MFSFCDLQTHENVFILLNKHIKTLHNNQSNNTQRSENTLRRCARIDYITRISATNQLSSIPVTSHWQHLVAISLYVCPYGDDPPPPGLRGLSTGVAVAAGEAGDRPTVLHRRSVPSPAPYVQVLRVLAVGRSASGRATSSASVSVTICSAQLLASAYYGT